MKNLSYQIADFVEGGCDVFALERDSDRRRLWVGLTFAATLGALVGVFAGSL